jgi:hypothetical protein
VLLKNVISAYTQRWLLILGLVYIVTILAAPQGLWNLGRRRMIGDSPVTAAPRTRGVVT